MGMPLPERFHANEAGEGRSNRKRAQPTLIDSRTHDETNRHKTDLSQYGSGHCPPLPADRLPTDGRNFDGKLSKSPKSLKNRFAAGKMLDRIRKLWYDYLTSLQRRFCCACILTACLCASALPHENALCPKEGGKLSSAVCPAARNLRKILHRRCRQCA